MRFGISFSIITSSINPDDLNLVISSLLAQIKKLEYVEDVEHESGPDELTEEAGSLD